MSDTTFIQSGDFIHPDHYKTREEIIEKEVIEKLRLMPPHKFYEVFGTFLEKVIEARKQYLQLRLKEAWKHQELYKFRDTGEQFEKDTMRLYFFDYKRLKKYSIVQMDEILRNLETQAISPE